MFDDLVRRFTISCGAFLAAVHLAATAMGGTIINVPSDQPTIQAAIDAAVDGDTVLVAPGTYNQTMDFRGKAIRVASDGGSEVTTLSGTGLGTSIVKFTTAEGPQSVLDGFKLTGGVGTGDALSSRRGGAVYAFGASPTILNCAFIMNKAQTSFTPTGCPSSYGGAVFHENGSMTLINCEFIGNQSRGSFGNGGGLYAGAANPLLIDCTFIDNLAEDFFGCFGTGTGFGGGISAGDGTLINCRFRGNLARGSMAGLGAPGLGGGAYAGSLYIDCEFSANTAAGGQAGAQGGGLFTNGTLVNCTIVNNSIVVNAPAPAPFNAGGVDGLSSGGPSLINCIVTGNSSLEVFANAEVTFSCIEGGFPGAGNIDADPLFVNAALNDFRLSDASPCRDLASNADLPADANDLDDDGDIIELLPLDIDLFQRVVNGVTDMGAHEWQTACPADISPSTPGVAGDGVINVADLLAVIALWGACDGCVADVNGDHQVNVQDLLAIISAWGTCLAK